VVVVVVVVMAVVELIGETASAMLDADFFRADPQVTHVGQPPSKACVLFD
jgi:hypothetical protein